MQHRFIGAAAAAVVLLPLLTSCSSPVPADTVGPVITAAPADLSHGNQAAPPAIYPVDPAAYTAHELGVGVTFVSPDRNLRCGITVTGDSAPLYGCAIGREPAWKFPREKPGDYCYAADVPCGYGIEASGAETPHPRKRDGAAFDSEYRTDIGVLEANTSISYADVVCTNDSEKISCLHTSGHGFAISHVDNDIW
ncbi:hypothetical protein [Agromyces humi]|uniref:hypothetical protein n=1 Tax=Agromyces humi TaxID=1766800 RepID=UPI00135C115E|nr:hypothetical protein [Agromyces humi]